jgi:general secretion pathway protein B
MSYILDALRRADAERERDPARGIHARPAAAEPARIRPRVPAWSWPAAAAVLLAGAGLLYWQLPAALQPAPTVAVLPVRVPAPAVVPIATVVRPAAPAPVVAAPVERVRVAAVASVAAPAPTAPVPATAVLAAPAPAADRVLNFAELPADVQRDLPKLAISGGVYSDNAVQRMLIVGGQVVNEGAELATGVVLEQIRPRSAVLRFRGYRYSVGY